MRSRTIDDQDEAPHERYEEITEILARAVVRVLLLRRMPETSENAGEHRLSSLPTHGSL